MDNISENTREVIMKMFSAICDYFKGVQWGNLGIFICVYMLLSMGNHLSHGYQFSSAVVALINDWPVYLTATFSYMIVSAIRQSKKIKK